MSRENQPKNGSAVLDGRIYRIDETTVAKRGDKEYHQRDFVVVYDKQWKNGDSKETPVRFIVKGVDACARLDNFQEGDAVRVRFDLDGWFHNSKAYTSLVAWGVTELEACEERPRKPLETSNRGNRYAPPAKADDFTEDEIPF